MPPPFLDVDPRGTRIRIKAVPGASRDKVAGALGDRLKIRVSAPPEGGKANDAITRLLARTLALRPRDIELLAGHASPEKTFLILGLSPADVAARLPG